VGGLRRVGDMLGAMRDDWLLDWTLPPGVKAVCTTRAGGVSLPPFDGFNLGDHVKDDPLAVAANRARLAKELTEALEDQSAEHLAEQLAEPSVVRPVFLQQVHGVNVVALHADTPDGTVADACWSDEIGVACTIMVADCLPVLLTHPDGGVVAAAHAGWRGLAGGVIEQTVSAMCQAKGLKAQHLSVWLGPCIGSTAFEVGDEVRHTFMQADANMQRYFKAHPSHSNKWLADLAGMARARLAALGIQDIHGNDSTPAWCTVGQSSRFFSYRRDGVTGRFAACIWRHS
jgi:YfiH family protein